MKSCKKLKTGRLLGFVVVSLAAVALRPTIGHTQEPAAPLADAGLPRYAAQDPVILDGSGSYDPDNSGPLTYTWRQISGRSVVISDAETATPTISGFVQTDDIQECEFELVVSDDELTSLPDTVKVIIVPAYPINRVPELRNEFFDPDKPTIILFRGGDGVYGAPEGNPYRLATDPIWLSKANIISFRAGYEPDNSAAPRHTYYRCGDMIIVYLSSVAPNYKQAIQSIGHSTGGLPAMDVGLHLNLTYKDRRYAVNRVTLLDVGNLYWRDLGSEDTTINQFLASSVDGEQCWIDDYWWGGLHVFKNILNVQYPVIGHYEVRYWYDASLTDDNKNQFNNGVVAGAYWSVIGPGKNLQLASTGDETYVFKWPGGLYQAEPIELYDESSYPGRLLEPVTLVGPEEGAIVDAEGALFSCEESINAVGYQLLFGPDPYHMLYLFSDTPSPPAEAVNTFPFEEVWWTIRAYDQHGSAIHADPMQITAEKVIAQTIENVITGQTYTSIQAAINDAHIGDEIVVGPGACQHLENISLKGKNLILRSTDPNDPDVVAATIINGGHRGPAVTFSGGEEISCVLDGFKITGGIVGLRYRDASPTVRNCTIESIPISIEFLYGSEPTTFDCTTLGSIMEVYGSDCVAHWKLDETEGDIAVDSVANCSGTLSGGPIWQPSGGIVDGALQFDGVDDVIIADTPLNPASGPFSVFAWVQGGAPGQAIISEPAGPDWLALDPLTGCLMTELMGTGRGASFLLSQTAITDGDWHRIGLVWDGSIRALYVDGMVVAQDTQNGLSSPANGFYIGCGENMQPGTFFSGLIDDVCIYNRAVNP